MKNMLHYALVSVVLAGSATSGYCAAPMEHVFSDGEAKCLRSITSIAMETPMYNDEFEDFLKDVQELLSAMNEYNTLPKKAESQEKSQQIKCIEKCLGVMDGFLKSYSHGSDYNHHPNLRPYYMFSEKFQKLDKSISQEAPKLYKIVRSGSFERVFENLQKFLPLIHEWNRIPENIQNAFYDKIKPIDKHKRIQLSFAYKIKHLKQILDNYCAKHKEYSKTESATKKCSISTERVYSIEETKYLNTVMSIAIDMKGIDKKKFETFIKNVKEFLAMMDKWNGLPEETKNQAKELEDEWEDKTPVRIKLKWKKRSKRIALLAGYFNAMEEFLGAYSQEENYKFPPVRVLLPWLKKTSEKMPDFYAMASSTSLLADVLGGLNEFVPLIHEWNGIPKNIQNAFYGTIEPINSIKKSRPAFVDELEQLKQVLDDYCAKHSIYSPIGLAGMNIDTDSK